ncbi:MAG: alpha-N-acetylglucosaminidase N-terminal domain-containing protein, partial [Opitutaceae bacterium]
MLTRRKFLGLSGAGIGAALTAGKLPAGGPAEKMPATAGLPSESDPVAAAAAVLRRTLGPSSAAFRLESISPEDGRQRFELAADGGTVHLKGSSAVALARAAYTYLRETGLGMVTWSGRRLDLPKRLPDHAAQRVVCP